jgi:hypothetical protein
MGDAHYHHDRPLGPVVFAAGLLVSAAWSAIAVFAGRPINDPVVLYIVYQLIAGFIAAIFAPRWIWGTWVAAFLGQGFAFVAAGGLAASSTGGIGFVLLPLFCLPTLLGGAIGVLVKSKKP